MAVFSINNENEIVAFGSAEEAAALATSPFDTFATQQELAELAAAWPAERFVEIWNNFSGVVPVKKFKSARTAISRIWGRIEGLGEAAEPETPKTNRKAKVRAPAAKGAPRKGKATPKAVPAKNAPKGKKTKESSGPREGSKTAQVVAMLQRKNGATLVEIVQKMGWQRHTVRGFMAGAMKKAGYTVESFQSEGGERTYRMASR